jgi:hypothetical protein
VNKLVYHPAFNIAIFALLLSPPWEFGQMWLYASTSEMSHLKGIRICMVATLGDAFIALFALAVVAAFMQSPTRVRAPRALLIRRPRLLLQNRRCERFPNIK